ncbi:hypothetical protein HK103_000722 [Boothiomyces macroporosus]|uniref:Uncharacterized protein n=1 Tax=Boothiomyces macroporosus TaxID=261099 RepID=A0AAD5Y3I3_9FUNG|nr:hypothetical protein HK103_000722 [Boothiomyces macroporosus]
MVFQASTYYTLASVGLAFGTFQQLGKSCTKFLDPLIQQGIDNPYVLDTFHKTGVRSVDTFLSFITPFFDAVLLKTGSLGTVSLIAIFSTATAWFTFASIESLRDRSKGLVKQVALVGLIGQLLGISVSFPLLWLSSFFFYKLHEKMKANDSSYVKPAGVYTAAASNLIFLLFTVSLGVVKNDSTRKLLIAIFQIAPVVFYTLPVYLHFDSNHVSLQVSRKGSEAVKKVYQLSALAFAVTHIGTCLYILQFPFITFGDFIKLLTTANPGPEGCAAFLLLEYFSLSVASLLYIASQGDITAVKKYLIQSVAVGPAAAFMLFTSKREQELIDEIDRINQNKKK